MVRWSRRSVLKTLAVLPGGAAFPALWARSEELRIAPFEADVTPPLGHALMGGGIEPARKIEDPLFAQGFALLGEERPVVVVTVDWCEIRNDAYVHWKRTLAEAAGTLPERVLISCIHQHDAPIADLRAQHLLESEGAGASICDPDFHGRAVARVAAALRRSLMQAAPVTHIGLGQATVREIASNRRFQTEDGRIAFSRTSATRDAWARSRPEGVVDPQLKALSFWEEDRVLLVLSLYAVHPMSYYGKGNVSADFAGMARSRRRADQPAVAQLYGSGCSGNVTAGKYNDGSPGRRPVLADRLYQAMDQAFHKTERFPLRRLRFHSRPLDLEPRSGAGFTEQELQERLRSDPRPFGRCLAALGLSWREQLRQGYRIDVPCLDFGPGQLLLLPAESYVEYQLFAQSLRPDSFVAVLGYGECAPGYIPIEQAWREEDTNLRDWCWVAPGSEERMKEAIRTVVAGA